MLHVLGSDAAGVVVEAGLRKLLASHSISVASILKFPAVSVVSCKISSPLHSFCVECFLLFRSGRWSCEFNAAPHAGQSEEQF
jgi:hypothetical protein